MMTQSKWNVPNDLYLWRVFESPLGAILVIVSELGVQRIDFVDGSQNTHLPTNPGTTTHPILHDALVQLLEYFAKKRTAFSLPLDLHGTEFQQQAWLSLAHIPYGETMTYGQQAAHIGRARAARAIGVANSKNPIAIVLPCHRVIGANGSLTGYAGGIDKKKWLLEHERSR